MTPTPHDALFKAVFSDPAHAAAQLASMLPRKLARAVDWSTLTLLSGSYVDEALRARHSDLLFSVRVNGKEVLLYLLFEHQSTTDPWMAFRFYVYMGRIWERWRAQHPDAETLPLIAPLVVSHAVGGWTAKTAFEELVSAPSDAWRAFVPRFSYAVDDLATVSDEELEARLLTSLARVALMMFRDLRRQPVRDALDRMTRWLVDVLSKETPPHLVSAVLQYVLHNRDEIEQTEVVSWLADIEPAEREGIMRSIAQKLLDDGRAEGRVEGRVEGLRVALRLQLRLKLGTSADLGPIDEADEATLVRWAERVLIARSAEDVFSS